MFLVLLLLNRLIPQTLDERVQQLEKQVVDDPRNISANQELQFIISDHYLALSAGARQRIRALLSRHCQFNKLVVGSAKEVGRRILIKGLVRRSGKVASNALMYVFQTDDNGVYSPLDRQLKIMNEADPRLFGFLKTDANGYFEISTIRPASYASKYKGLVVPQHIHFIIDHNSERQKSVQMIFKDDPAVSDQWIRWAAELNYPIVDVDYSSDVPEVDLKIELSNNKQD